MKCIFPFFLMAAFCTAAQAQTCNLTINIPNFKNTKGNVQVAVYNTEKSFPKSTGQYKLETFAVDKARGTYVVPALPKGIYAVAILHDENSDHICNTNMFGIPKEGYGFSKNFKPILSAPVFKDCSIPIQADTTIEIKLIY